MNKCMRAKSWLCALVLAVAFRSRADAVKLTAGAGSATDDEWAYYGRDAGGMRYSPLTQTEYSWHSQCWLCAYRIL